MIEENEGDWLHKETFADHKTSMRQFMMDAKTRYRGVFLDVDMDSIKYKGDRVNGEDGQRSFISDELIKLFTCKEMKSYCKKGKDVGKFWLPAIALYTGMRVNEICQLNPDTDILKDEDTGVWYFLISAKTESSPDIEKSVNPSLDSKINNFCKNK